MNYLFRSLPDIEERVLPKITPSGFSIGTIKKFTLLLKSSAYLLPPNNISMKPLSTCDPLDSPGCTLPVITMFFFLLSSLFS